MNVLAIRFLGKIRAEVLDVLAVHPGKEATDPIERVILFNEHENALDPRPR
jgi:hypothetical protein